MVRLVPARRWPHERISARRACGGGDRRAHRATLHLTLALRHTLTHCESRYGPAAALLAVTVARFAIGSTGWCFDLWAQRMWANIRRHPDSKRRIPGGGRSTGRKELPPKPSCKWLCG